MGKLRFFLFAVANVMYEKLIVSELLLIISIYIHSTYELKMDSRISTNGSGKNDAEDFFIFFFFLNSCFSIFIYHLLFFFYARCRMLSYGVHLTDRRLHYGYSFIYK